MVKIPKSPAFAIIGYIESAIFHCNMEFWQLLPIAHNSWLKLKKNTIFAIYRPYWICHISLQHGWVDRYYGPPCSPVYVISYCSYRILATFTNSTQFMVKIQKDTVFFHSSAILDPPYFIATSALCLAMLITYNKI